MTPSSVRVAAHAKLNLFLRVLARERSGFHQIETAFALVELADEIVVTRTDGGGGVTLTVEGPDLGPAEDNLAVRAARAGLESIAGGTKFGVAIALTKRIPVKAGLGGGSSDAAAVLQAVNALANQAVPRHELLHLATRLGADVGFFAGGAPMALAWGRGERLFRLAALPAAPALIAVPKVAVATPDAYRWWDAMNPEPGPRGPLLLDAEAFSGWGSVGRLGGNDFEMPVFAKHPEVRALYERMATTRPLWVRLCGSGSAVAAVYKSARDRDDAVATLDKRLVTPIATTTRAVAAAGPVAGD